MCQKDQGDIAGMQVSNEINVNSEYGGFWIRVVAYSIDAVVLAIPLHLVPFLLHTVFLSADGADKVIFDVLGVFFNVLVWWVYSAVLHSSVWQATIGKKVVGLKVVDKSGNRISFGRATGRYFAEFLSVIVLGIGYLMVGWTKKKQGLHDIIAKTYVIRAMKGREKKRD